MPSVSDVFGKIGETESVRVKQPETSGIGRVKKVKAAREAAPGLSGPHALAIVDALAKFNTEAGPVALTADESKAAEAALRANTGYQFETQIRAVVGAINRVRAGDAEGIVRKSDAGQYAFSVGNGTYLVIQAGPNPRYRTASDAEAKDIKKDWEIVR